MASLQCLMIDENIKILYGFPVSTSRSPELPILNYNHLWFSSKLDCRPQQQEQRPQQLPPFPVYMIYILLHFSVMWITGRSGESHRYKIFRSIRRGENIIVDRLYSRNIEILCTVPEYDEADDYLRCVHISCGETRWAV